MIRSKKLCFGVLSVFFTIFGLLFVGSSDTSALQYTLDYIPYTIPSSGANNGQLVHDNFSFYGTRNGTTSSLKNVGYYFNATLDNNNDCRYSLYHSIRSSNTYSYSIPYYIQPPSDFSGDVPAFFYCSPDTALSGNNLNTISSTLPSNPNLRDYLPYRYNYNGAFIHSTLIENELSRSSKLDFSELFENGLPDTVKNIKLPIGTSSVTLNSGSTLEFKGEFLLDSTYPDSDQFTLSSNAHLKIYASFFGSYSDYLNHNSTPASISGANCSLSYSRNPVVSEYPHIVDYSCYITVPSTLSSYSLSGYSLEFSSSDYVWTLPNSTVMVYESSVVITNNDPTPTSDKFQDFEIYSSKSFDQIPGYVGSLPTSGNCASDDWFCNLTNLFNFSFVNPFAPIFQMFTDNSSCASIPTIAGLIHSEETQVCPWFDSNVRSIVTPVLSIASVMLIFGFAVRWLGSRSGNFIEDSEGVDSGRFHIGKRGKK